MDFDTVISTTSAQRAFEPVPVDDELLYSVLDLAKYAPSGGNRQGWRVVVIKDPSIRIEIRKLYVEAWAEYMAHVEAGLVPFAPVEDRKWLRPAVDLEAAVAKGYRYEFSDHLESAPALLAVFVRLGSLAILDNGLDRQSIVGGASIYPFVHNIMLAARSKGLGGVMTTALCRREEQVAEILSMPDEFALASLVVLGWPKAIPKKLKRQQVSAFTTLDRFDGVPFDVSGAVE